MTYFEVLSVHDLLQHLASVGEITKPGKWIYKDLALLAFYRFTCCTKLPQSLLPMFISFFLSFVRLRGIIIAIFRSFGTNHIWSFWDLAPKCVCGPNLITLPFFRLDFFRFYEANVNLKGLPWQPTWDSSTCTLVSEQLPAQSHWLWFNVTIHNLHLTWFPHDSRKAVLALLLTSGFMRNY